MIVEGVSGVWADKRMEVSAQGVWGEMGREIVRATGSVSVLPAWRAAVGPFRG